MQQRDFQQPGRSVAVSDRAMAATSHPLATLAAIDILRAGGNAVDAAIAAVALQGVIDPLMTGIGGDCFALLAPEGGTPIAFNGSGRSPRALDAGWFAERGLTEIDDNGPHAVTIPGAVDAWCQLNARHGRLELAQILAPAIAAAADGFCITPRVAFDWELYQSRVARHADSAAHFLPGGRPPRVGERFHQPALAETLRTIARYGRAGFYEGSVAANVVKTLQDAGGLHTISDFAIHKGFETAPISGAFRGRDVLECPPNGQGLAALLIARILDGFDLADSRYSWADRIHLHAEATKLGYAMRDVVISDPKTAHIDPEAILDDALVGKLRGSIRLDRAGPFGEWIGPTHRDTVYVTVVDEDRNAVSLINSVFHAFGSGIYAPGSGVLLQSRGAGFSLAGGHPNRLAGGKLPFHTIIPAMLMQDGAAVMPFGVMGGQYQAAGHAHLLSHILDLGLDPQAANAAPRSFAFGGVLTLETTIPDAVRADLAARGHRTEWATEPLGGCQAIFIDRQRGVLLGSSDHRKDGIALGY